MKEFRETIPLSFYYLTHCEIYEHSFRGMTSREQLYVMLRMFHNHSKEHCILIIKELEILGLLKQEDKVIKIIKPERTKEEFILYAKKKLNLV